MTTLHYGEMFCMVCDKSATLRCDHCGGPLCAECKPKQDDCHRARSALAKAGGSNG